MATATDKPTESTRRAPGVVRDGEVYTDREFRARTGVGINALPRLERKGLRIIRLEKKVFIAGRDWINFLETQSGMMPPIHGCCAESHAAKQLRAKEGSNHGCTSKSTA
jgi:hypothetical protein